MTYNNNPTGETMSNTQHAGDLISREAAINALVYLPDRWRKVSQDYIRALPAATEAGKVEWLRARITELEAERDAALAAQGEPVALRRSFPDVADGRPMPPMGDELMTAGLNADDARFVAVQFAQNGLTLVSAPASAGVTVKPLVWVEHGVGLWRAILGTLGDGRIGWEIITLSNSGFYLSPFMTGRASGLRKFGSLEEAQEAAQAECVAFVAALTQPTRINDVTNRSSGGMTATVEATATNDAGQAGGASATVACSATLYPDGRLIHRDNCSDAIRNGWATDSCPDAPNAQVFAADKPAAKGGEGGAV